MITPPASPAEADVPVAAPEALPRRYVVLGLVFALGLAILVMSWWYVPGYGAGVDEASYFLAAKGLATHFDPAYYNDDPLVFVPENMVEARPGVFYPKYPIGYPLLCAIAYRIGGPGAAFLISPILLIAALLGVFFLGRLFLNNLFALVAVFFMALHPAVLHYGVAALSHAADLACSTWCIFFACWWYKKPGWGKALAAGTLLGYAISIRYTEALLALPVGFLLLARVWDAWRKPAGGGRPTAWRKMILHAAAGAAGGLIGILPLLWYHWSAFGSPFKTGYALTGEAAAFSVSSFVHHFPLALRTLAGFATGLSLFLPLGVLAMAVGLRKQFRPAFFFILWCVPTLLLYSAYYWVNAEEPVLYVRFFLTLFPAFVLPALMLVDRLAGKRRVVRYVAAGAIVLLSAFNLLSGRGEDRFTGTAFPDVAAAELIQQALPPDAVIVADGFSAFSIVYYTDTTVLYPGYFSDRWVTERLRPAEPDRPADFNPLRRERFAARVEGKSGEELDELLRQRLLAFARDHRTLALVTMSYSDPWYIVLSGAFDATRVAENEGAGVKLFRLTPKSGGQHVSP